MLKTTVLVVKFIKEFTKLASFINLSCIWDVKNFTPHYICCQKMEPGVYITVLASYI